MKKRNIPIEFVYQLFALIIAIIIVHAFYVSIVRPNAAQIIVEQNQAAAVDPDYVRERSTWVVIKDFEQESCFILMFWALAIMGYKAVNILDERKLLEVDLVPVAEGMRILPEDTREFASQVQQLPDENKRMLLPRALLNALQRFSTTRNIQDVEHQYAHDLRVGGRQAGIGIVDDPLHLLGNSLDRVYRHRTRYR